MSTKLRAVPAELRDTPLGGGGGVPVAVGNHDELEQLSVLGERAERRLLPREVPCVAEERVDVGNAEVERGGTLRSRMAMRAPRAASLSRVRSCRRPACR